MAIHERCFDNHFNNIQTGPIVESSNHQFEGCNLLLYLSFDYIDSTLCLKGYELSSVPTNENDNFLFLKNSTLGQIDMITVFTDKETGNFVMCSISDNEKLFSSIKERCEDNSWHPVKKEEKFSEGSYSRIYCDGTWKYKFTISNDVELGTVYKVYVMSDSRCF